MLSTRRGRIYQLTKNLFELNTIESIQVAGCKQIHPRMECIEKFRKNGQGRFNCDLKDIHVEPSPLPIVQKWSATSSENVEIIDIHPSVPLDIALLHIKTDELLESLRQSAITPKCRDQISPTSTKSTFECTVENDSCLSSVDKGEGFPVSDIQDQDCKSISSFDSDDDGMKWEIQQLNNIMLEMKQSFSELILTSSKTCEQDENQLNSNCIVVDDLNNFLLLLSRDILMLFKDISMIIIHSSTLKMMASSKTGRSFTLAVKSRPRFVLMLTYIIVSMAYLCVKVAWRYAW
jgi:hypothetical protein